MGIVELLLIAVGLSMDAFAVSICKGLGMKKVDLKVAVVLALFFGGFQGLMPLIGWTLGSQFLWLIAPVDHWIAFGLLAIIGGKMLWEAFRDEEGEDDGRPADRIDLGEFFILAIATSIDALAVGISFAALSVDIVPSVLLIGIVSGSVITALVYAALIVANRALFGIIPGIIGKWLGAIPFLTVGVPAVISLYFDWFGSFMQAFIFCMLTMMYISTATD